ncbi:ammonia-forming cytochrome c nitrite reductase subunit c552 [Oryzomonas sagensis]|uniref:Ammonia-forming cytochrome c nitrite reductase subunit c552 n=1 Tax=Oryzomonas sagensis TaxID=2603857 RepID=A0ABQ6TRA5_9BACT|nr:ammonia-forming cytochrome c nitrite reductase subunit c552 [Oryzomonas sagensis]KAB0671578.1 ammonia-forming cytochrome c nitrite reductase subunit c552 [Oryzomonas sagensis]
MQIKKLSMMLLGALSCAVLLNGCGASSKEAGILPSDVPKVDEALCAQCHSTGIDTVAGTKIYEAYLGTGHYKSGEVGCQDCHGGGSQHNGVGPLPYPDPSAAGKCFACHQNYLKYDHGHFFNYTAAAGNNGRPAVYVSLNYQKSCTSCHDPHLAENGVRNGEASTVTTTTAEPQTLTIGAAKGTEHKDWAETAGGHGDVNGPAFGEDFKFDADCNRCHTSTGFINYVNSGYAYPAPAWGTTGDKTKEVITCAACHTSYNFKNRVRQAPQVVAPYNSGKNPWTFPNASASNLCIACHSARENGNTVKALYGTFTSARVPSPHYLPAAGMMYISTGFKDFTTSSASYKTSATATTTYAKTLTIDSTSDSINGIAGGVTSTHRKLGTTAINGDSHNPSFFVAGTLDSNGPCVTCHLNGSGVPSRGSSHTLAINQDAINQVCSNCHTSEGGHAIATVTDFQTYFLEPQSESYQNAIKLAIDCLKTTYGITFTAPSTFKIGSKTVTDWTLGTHNQKFGQKLLGAAFNIRLLTNETAAYAHARSYTRRLVYDTIDFLDDGVMNQSVSTTATTKSATVGNPVYGLFGMGTAAYTDGTLTTLSPGTTESMIFLIGWSRSTGAWNSSTSGVSERP